MSAFLRTVIAQHVFLLELGGGAFHRARGAPDGLCDFRQGQCRLLPEQSQNPLWRFDRFFYRRLYRRFHRRF
jgi:hypothetical protein